MYDVQNHPQYDSRRNTVAGVPVDTYIARQLGYDPRTGAPVAGEEPEEEEDEDVVEDPDKYHVQYRLLFENTRRTTYDFIAIVTVTVVGGKTITWEETYKPNPSFYGSLLATRAIDTADVIAGIESCKVEFKIENYKEPEKTNEIRTTSTTGGGTRTGTTTKKPKKPKKTNLFK
jgi:hypothetical protein